MHCLHLRYHSRTSECPKVGLTFTAYFSLTRTIFDSDMSGIEGVQEGIDLISGDLAPILDTEAEVVSPVVHEVDEIVVTLDYRYVS